MRRAALASALPSRGCARTLAFVRAGLLLAGCLSRRGEGRGSSAPWNQGDRRGQGLVGDRRARMQVRYNALPFSSVSANFECGRRTRMTIPGAFPRLAVSHAPGPGRSEAWA
jgi:hypothetical protein